MIDRFISWLYTRRFYGPRCPEFGDGCPVCEAWEQHDEFVDFMKELSDD